VLEDMQPAGLVGHDAAHDVVEGLTLARVGLIVVEHVACPILGVLEDAIRRVKGKLNTVFGQVLRHLEEAWHWPCGSDPLFRKAQQGRLVRPLTSWVKVDDTTLPSNEKIPHRMAVVPMLFRSRLGKRGDMVLICRNNPVSNSIFSTRKILNQIFDSVFNQASESIFN
jgi:hypothetical protein